MQLPKAPETGRRSRTLAFPVDQIGIWTSTLCVIHCLLTPVLLSLSAVSAHFLPSEERTHRTLAVAIVALGGHCASKGYRRHRSSRVLRRRLLGRSPSIAHCGGSRHFGWQRIHGRRAQNQSHILSGLQPLRLESLRSLVALVGSQRRENRNFNWRYQGKALIERLV